MEEVPQDNKKIWIILAAIVAVLIVAGIAIAIFSSSSNKTEKATQDQTIGEILDSCMQTCSQLPAGSTRDNCEAGCAQAKQTVPSEFEKAGIPGAEDMTTDQVLQEIIAKCITRCQTDPEIPVQYQEKCIENCKATQ